MAGRASSQVTEVMVWADPNAPRRVSSVVVEVMVWADPNAPRRVSSVVVEVICRPGGGASVASGYWW